VATGVCGAGGLNNRVYVCGEAFGNSAAIERVVVIIVINRAIPFTAGKEN
jgi:ABC-type methionine transport system permease subunit